MNNYLDTIADKTDTDIDVLKKIVQLALYNESLYGLNDHAVRANVDNQNLNNDPFAQGEPSPGLMLIIKTLIMIHVRYIPLKIK